MPTQVFLSFCYGASNVLSFVCFGVSSLATCSVIIPKRRWMPDLASFHNIESNFHISPSAIISTLIDRAWYHVWTETEMFRCQMNQMWCDQDIITYFQMKFVWKAKFAFTPVVAEDDILFPEKKVSLPRYLWFNPTGDIAHYSCFGFNIYYWWTV